LNERDMEAAQDIVEREHKVDALELKADEEVVSIIARRGPVAGDLRLAMSFSKAITDLERIGDEAVRVAHLAVMLFDNNHSDPGEQLLRDVYAMGEMSFGMLHEAISAFDTFSAERAEKVAREHNKLDGEFQSSLRRLTTYVLEDARNVGHAINIVLILKALERIGEHASNLAEYVVYLVKGVDIRHQRPTENP
jgi:phosphate transport system protein